MAAVGDETHGRARRRRMEIFAFLFLTAVMMPALAVATVGSYGLAVWVYQMMAGPPGPPSQGPITVLVGALPRVLFQQHPLENCISGCSKCLFFVACRNR